MLRECGSFETVAVPGENNEDSNSDIDTAGLDYLPDSSIVAGSSAARFLDFETNVKS